MTKKKDNIPGFRLSPQVTDPSIRQKLFEKPLISGTHENGPLILTCLNVILYSLCSLYSLYHHHLSPLRNWVIYPESARETAPGWTSMGNDINHFEKSQRKLNVNLNVHEKF